MSNRATPRIGEGRAATRAAGVTEVRPATAQEVAGIGWRVEGDQAQSPDSLAWYALAEFRVSSFATLPDGERRAGRWLSLQSEFPAGERLLVNLADPGAAGTP